MVFEGTSLGRVSFFRGGDHVFVGENPFTPPQVPGAQSRGRAAAAQSGGDPAETERVREFL